MKFVKQEVSCNYPENPISMLRRLERAGRISHKSEDNITEDSYKSFLKMLIKLGHESVLEHATLSVHAITERGISHEIVRHRIGSYTQESTRYCNYANDKFDGELTLIASDDILDDSYALECLLYTETCYKHLIKKGIRPEMARDILPNCLKTEIIMTYNIRSWRHFFKERLNKNAHPKIRELAMLILKDFHKNIPVLFDDIWEQYASSM